MIETWIRIECWLKANAYPVWERLQPGAEYEEIAATENLLGVQLPEEVKASYRLHNGHPPDKDSFLGVLEFLSLAGIRQQWSILKSLRDDGCFYEMELRGGDADVFTWYPQWIPLTNSGAGDHYCLDLRPDIDGRGQIITYWHDDPVREIVAPNFRKWLESYADRLESGQIIYSETGELLDVNDL